MSKFSALQARENVAGGFEQVIVQRDIDELPAGELLIRGQVFLAQLQGRLVGQWQPRRNQKFSAPPRALMLLVWWKLPAWPSLAPAMRSSSRVTTSA